MFVVVCLFVCLFITMFRSAVVIYFFIGGTIVMAILDSFYWLYLLQVGYALMVCL